MININSQSVVNFVYPFTYSTNCCKDLVNHVKHLAWEGRNATYKVWDPYEITKLPDIALLPSVSKFIDPESESPYFNAGAWLLSDQALNSVKSGLGRDKVEWNYVSSQKSYRIKFEEIHLYLFTTGIGFLGVQISLPNTTSSDDWLDLIHSLRFSSGPRAQGSYFSGCRRDTNEPFLPAFLDSIGVTNDLHFQPNDLITGLLRSTSYDNIDDHKWWSDIYTKDYLIPYFSLDCEIINEEERDPFLYRLDSFLKSTSMVLLDENSNVSLRKRMVYMWMDQCFVFNVEGGGFISFNTPQDVFFQKVLPDHILKHYYLLFLTVLQQKFFISYLSEKIADVWIKGRNLRSNNEKYIEYLQIAFSDLQDLLLTFSSIGNFSQIMYSQHHHDVYLKWRDIQGIDQVYDEVRAEIEYVYNYVYVENEKIKQSFNKRIEITIQGISTIIAFPAFALTILDLSRPELSLGIIWRTIISWGLVGGLVFFAIQYSSKYIRIKKTKN